MSTKNFLVQEACFVMMKISCFPLLIGQLLLLNHMEDRSHVLLSARMQRSVCSWGQLLPNKPTADSCVLKHLTRLHYFSFNSVHNGFISVFIWPKLWYILWCLKLPLGQFAVLTSWFSNFNWAGKYECLNFYHQKKVFLLSQCNLRTNQMKNVHFGSIICLLRFSKHYINRVPMARRNLD